LDEFQYFHVFLHFHEFQQNQFFVRLLISMVHWFIVFDCQFIILCDFLEFEWFHVLQNYHDFQLEYSFMLWLVSKFRCSLIVNFQFFIHHDFLEFQLFLIYHFDLRVLPYDVVIPHHFRCQLRLDRLINSNLIILKLLFSKE